MISKPLGTMGVHNIFSNTPKYSSTMDPLGFGDFGIIQLTRVFCSWLISTYLGPLHGGVFSGLNGGFFGDKGSDQVVVDVVVLMKIWQLPPHRHGAWSAGGWLANGGQNFDSLVNNYGKSPFLMGNMGFIWD